MLYTKHFAEQLAQHATSFWINKREETGGSAGYKIENYIEENDAFLQHYVDMEYEEEEDEDCECGEKLLICDSGMKLCSVGCKDIWVNSKGEEVEEEEKNTCYKCDVEVSQDNFYRDQFNNKNWECCNDCGEETSIYNGIELPRFVDGREVISYPNAGLPK